VCHTVGPEVSVPDELSSSPCAKHYARVAPGT
jgi:hypothetical protein